MPTALNIQRAQDQFSSSPKLRNRHSPDSGIGAEQEHWTKMSRDISVQADLLDLNNPFTMAHDYLKYWLAECDLVYWNCPDLPDVTDARLAMRQMAGECARRYSTDLASMVAELNVNSDTVYPSFQQLADQLFNDGIHWGRVVALFAFAGAVSVRCVIDGHRDLVGQIANFLGIFVRDRLMNWVHDHGGWAGFVAWYDGQGTDNYWQHSPWKRLGLMAGVGVVGAFTLKRMLSG